MTHTLQAHSIKIVVPIGADALPRNVLPDDGPAPPIDLKVQLKGGSFFLRAPLNGKSYRKILNAIAANGTENVVTVLQGELRPTPQGTPPVSQGYPVEDVSSFGEDEAEAYLSDLLYAIDEKARDGAEAECIKLVKLLVHYATTFKAQFDWE
jgi:hypothetical protein